MSVLVADIRRYILDLDISERANPVKAKCQLRKLQANLGLL